MIENLDKLIASKSFNIKQNSFAVDPIIYDLTNAKQEQEFKNLLEDNTIQLYDAIYDQLTELIKIKNVSKKLSTADITALISEHLQNTPIEKYGFWIYYPWLNKVVHILKEEEFIEVRTNRNQHKITKRELAVLRTKKIGLIGLSVGQSITFTLILERCCGEIRIADFDDIQLSNLNRIKTGLHNIGVSKTIQAAREIAEFDPFIKISCFNDGINENNIDDFLTGNGIIDILVEECDSIDIKILARIKAKALGIPVVMETNDRGMIDIERYDLDKNYPLLHGLLGDVSYENLKGITPETALPFFMKFFSFDSVSDRGKVTLVELGQTVSTWPQLASSVMLGAGLVADTVRRILLNELNISGRFYVDTQNIIHNTNPDAALYTPPQIKELDRYQMKEIATTINVEKNGIEIPTSFIEAIVKDAMTAPSSGNDQPWKFFFNNNILYLFHDTSRSYSFGNYQNIASYISLGTVIENTVLSSHHNNHDIAVNFFPNNNNQECIAAIKFESQQTALTESHEFDNLYKFINVRCTNRKIVKNETAPDSVLQELRKATESIDDAKVSFITDKDDLKELGLIISACDRIRIMNPQGHYEFFNREIRWSKASLEAEGTGMDVSTLELGPPQLLALKTISNDKVMQALLDIDGLKAYKAAAVPATINAAAMGLVTMPEYSRLNFVNGGRAVQRQWLKATELGYAYHPLLIPIYLFPRIIFGGGEGLTANVISELKNLRERFMQMFPGDEKRGEVFLFRIFKAENIKEKSLRLPLSKILYT